MIGCGSAALSWMPIERGGLIWGVFALYEGVLAVFSVGVSMGVVQYSALRDSRTKVFARAMFLVFCSYNFAAILLGGIVLEKPWQAIGVSLGFWWVLPLYLYVFAGMRFRLLEPLGFIKLEKVSYDLAGWCAGARKKCCAVTPIVRRRQFRKLWLLVVRFLFTSPKRRNADVAICGRSRPRSTCRTRKGLDPSLAAPISASTLPTPSASSFRAYSRGSRQPLPRPETTTEPTTGAVAALSVEVKVVVDTWHTESAYGNAARTDR